MVDAWGNWIAVGALAVSAYALIAGEVRARTRRRQAVQRNIVEWDLRWTDEKTVSLVNQGPDEARDVYVKFMSSYQSVTATAKRLAPGQSLPLDVSDIKEIADAWRYEPAPEQRGLRLMSFMYGIVVSWHYRNGPRDQWALEAPMFKIQS